MLAWAKPAKQAKLPLSHPSVTSLNALWPQYAYRYQTVSNLARLGHHAAHLTLQHILHFQPKSISMTQLLPCPTKPTSYFVLLLIRQEGSSILFNSMVEKTHVIKRHSRLDQVPLVNAPWSTCRPMREFFSSLKNVIMCNATNNTSDNSITNEGADAEHCSSFCYCRPYRFNLFQRYK